MIIASMLVMIGRVRERKLKVLISCMYIRGLFESQYYINKVDVDWVFLAPFSNLVILLLVV
jgi:hypothetical protein